MCASPSVRDQPAALRQLKLLVVVLVLSNLALGGFSFYVLRTLDQNYSELILGAVPLLNDLQGLTAQSVETMRETGPALFNTPANERAAAVQRTELAITADRRLRTAILNRPWRSSLDTTLSVLKVAGENFTKIATDVVHRYATGETAEATRLRDERLRPAFAQYLDATTKAADILEAESLKASEALSVQAGSTSKWVLGAASWPIALLAGLLALTAIFVVVLMVLFRGREMSDMP